MVSSDGLDPPQELRDVRRDSARHRTLDDKGGDETTWAARRGHAPLGVPVGKFFDAFYADIATLNAFLFELCQIRIAGHVYWDGDE